LWAPETSAKATLQRRAEHELKEFAILSLFRHRSIAASPSDLFGRRLEERSPATSSCRWCSFRFSLSASSAKRSAKAG
jgi:hypothetical protein